MNEDLKNYDLHDLSDEFINVEWIVSSAIDAAHDELLNQINDIEGLSDSRQNNFLILLIIYLQLNTHKR